MRFKRPVRRAGVSALLLTAAVASGVFTQATAHGTSADTGAEQARTALSAPYRDWNVRVTQHEGNARVLDVSFDSPLLERRVTNRVHLPDSYRPDGPALPVMYYLHGTIQPTLDNPLFGPVTKNEALLDAIGPGGGAVQTDIFRFEKQLDKAKFVLVAPDTSRENTICDTCIWQDGQDDAVPNAHPVTAETLPADSFLHEELYPLIEDMFTVRSDRAGRAVMGFSMGGVAAYLQGMRHPDQYALSASVSGVLDVLDEPGGRAIWESMGYMRDQGYGTGLTHEAEWRGLNPKDLASNLSGVDHEVFTSSGDVCLSLSSLGHPDCQRLSPVTNPAAAAVETVIARQYGLNARALPKAGVSETRTQFPGVHGANNHRVYAEKIVPLANKIFARGVSEPSAFRYRSTETSFQVWGFDVSVKRDGTEFLDMTEVATDGTTFQLRGSGTAKVLTPPGFEPGRSYEVTATADDGTRSRRSVVADGNGRLPVIVDLGRGTVIDKLVQTTGVKSQRSISVVVR